MRRDFKYFVAVIMLCCIGVVAQVSPTMPAPNRNMTAPSAHRPPGDHPETVAGTIEGFVYWDANTINHIPANSCGGLAIAVSVGSSSGSPLTAYTPLATLSNNFKYVGQVKTFLAGGKINVYDVCTYAYDKVPVGPPLQVTLTVPQPLAFSPVVAPQFAAIGSITIINAKCNMLPPITNPTSSDLFAHWGSCQDRAYNVNFMMMPSAHILGLRAGAGTPSGSGSIRGEKDPGPAGSPVLRNPGPPGTPMLSSAPQQGMLANGAGSTTQLQPANGGVQQIRGPATSAITDGTRQTYTGTTRTATTQTLTNADVISMLKAGLAESVIVSSIQSARKNFNFSPAGCQALQRARVSVAILASMGKGSVRPCSAITGSGGLSGSGDTTNPGTASSAVSDYRPSAATPGSKVELNPQPLPPRTATGAGAAAPGAKSTLNRQQMLAVLKKPSAGSLAAIAPGRFAPPKALKKVVNPRLAEQSASIIAALEQQRQAAETEAVAMKAETGAIASAASARTPVLSANVQRNTVQGLGPQTAQSSSTVNSQISHVSPFNGIVILCAKDPSPRIVQVNEGEGHGTIFTPEAKYNLYTISGCSFGPSRAGNSAYIFAYGGFKANLNIDSWGENGITAHLDPWLAGVSDQDNVTLVVVPAVGRGIQQPGFKFYAARGMPRVPDKTPEEVPLAYNSLPSTGMKLSSVTDVQVGWNGVPQNATQKFPSFSFQGTPVAGWTFRYAYGHDDSGEFFNNFDPSKTVGDYECWINGQEGFEGTHEFVGIGMQQREDCSTYFDKTNIWQNNLWGPLGADQWNIPLWRDFVISSYNLYYQDTDASQLCGAWDDSSKDSGHVGNWWDFNLTDANQITVSWPLYWCFDQEAWPFNRLNAQRQSAYGLAVWVWGPRCVDPLTDKPDQACMAKVRQILGS